MTRDDLQRRDQFLARCRGVDDAVDPTASRGVARVGGLFVVGLYAIANLRQSFGVDLFSLALERCHRDVEQRIHGLFAPHHGAPCRWPGVDQSRVERFAAKRIVARPVRAADQYRKLRHAAIAYRAHKLRTGLDDAGMFAIAADHEAVDVLQENQR